MEQFSCPSCHIGLLETYFFCPHCGKKIKEPPVSTSFGKQIGIYAVSILLPPLGLFPGFKYLLQNDPKAKIIGAVAIALTIMSLALTIQFTIHFANQLNETLNQQLQLTPEELLQQYNP